MGYIQVPYSDVLVWRVKGTVLKQFSLAYYNESKKNQRLVCFIIITIIIIIITIRLEYHHIPNIILGNWSVVWKIGVSGW